MKNVYNSPWLSVSLAIVGLTTGYGVYIVSHGEVAHASYFCPAKQVCNEAKCNTEGACGTTDCKRCPHCNNKATP